MSVISKTHFSFSTGVLSLIDGQKQCKHFLQPCFKSCCRDSDFRKILDCILFQFSDTLLFFAIFLHCKSLEFACNCLQMINLYSTYCHLTCLATVSWYFADKFGKMLKMHLCPARFFCRLMINFHACLHSFYLHLMLFTALPQFFPSFCKGGMLGSSVLADIGHAITNSFPMLSMQRYSENFEQVCLAKTTQQISTKLGQKIIMTL